MKINHIKLTNVNKKELQKIVNDGIVKQLKNSNTAVYKNFVAKIATEHNFNQNKIKLTNLRATNEAVLVDVINTDSLCIVKENLPY